ncbi:hypothetical protein LPJ70_003775, partial [Coemansia sp. RSA 2708]
ARFEVIQGLLDTVMESLNVSHVSRAKQGNRYRLVEANVPMYLPERSARVVYESDDGRSVELGTIGIVHPEVLAKFKLRVPVSTFEINIEPFL